eukprot:gene2607-3308_t
MAARPCTDGKCRTAGIDGIVYHTANETFARDRHANQPGRCPRNPHHRSGNCGRPGHVSRECTEDIERNQQRWPRRALPPTASPPPISIPRLSASTGQCPNRLCCKCGQPVQSHRNGPRSIDWRCADALREPRLDMGALPPASLAPALAAAVCYVCGETGQLRRGPAPCPRHGAFPSPPPHPGHFDCSDPNPCDDTAPYCPVCADRCLANILRGALPPNTSLTCCVPFPTPQH